MLFNSLSFIVFLFFTLLGFYAIGRTGKREWVLAWLSGTSLFFYGWWSPAYLILFVGSCLFNYGFGLVLEKRVSNRKGLLGLGIAVNLVVLAFFKYKNFFLEFFNLFYDTGIHYQPVVIPLGISFFTFQQIAYRIEVFRGMRDKDTFLEYLTSVAFFPHLIAGPIVYYSELLPQFRKTEWTKLSWDNICIGFILFTFGLVKKVVIADTLAEPANYFFSLAESGAGPTFFEGWVGVTAYTLQLYFDFSGYCEMALGLAWMFNIRLPINFYSPLKTTNIIDFWNQWHITLSRFLRQYLYTPLFIHETRKGRNAGYYCIFITMLLAGLWHGANWTFVIWGGIQGLFLITNHIWRKRMGRRAPWGLSEPVWDFCAWAITFTSVVGAYTWFRAESVASALRYYRGLLGFNGVRLPHFMGGEGFFRYNQSINSYFTLALLFVLILGVRFAPNIYELLGKESPGILDSTIRPIDRKWPHWLTMEWVAVPLGILSLFVFKTFFSLSPTIFLYFNF